MAPSRCPMGRLTGFWSPFPGLPDRSSEHQLVRDQLVRHPLDQLKPVVDAAQIVDLQAAVREIKGRRQRPQLRAGYRRRHPQSRRYLTGRLAAGGIALVHTCQGLAFAQGRSYVIPDDMQKAAVPVLAHHSSETRIISKRGRRGRYHRQHRRFTPGAGLDSRRQPRSHADA